MSIFSAAVGVPIWLLGLGVGLPTMFSIVTGSLLYRFWSNPEIKIFSKAVMNPNLYIVMDHTSYGYVRFHTAKIGKMSLDGDKQLGIKFIPRDEGHVEQSANFRIVHTIQGHPYPVNSVTAYAIEGCCEKLREAGLPLSTNILDALFRAKLDKTKMCGYVEEKIEEQDIDEYGNPVFRDEQAYDESGMPLFNDVPVLDEYGQPVYIDQEMWDDNGIQHIMRVPQTQQMPVMEKIPVTRTVLKSFQFQLSEAEFEQLENIKQDLEHTFVGYDHLGGSVFAWQHVSDVVTLGASVVSTDVQALVDNARREALLKAKKKEHNLILYAIVAFILCIGAAAFIIVLNNQAGGV